MDLPSFAAVAIPAFFGIFTDPYLLGLILLTTVAGVIIGALPGLGATTGAALLLPFTLTMDPVYAITVLTTIYCSATFAGAITAILINTPGTPRRRPQRSTDFRWRSAVKPAARLGSRLSPPRLAGFSRSSPLPSARR
jgi:hypothetical protein